MADLPAVTGPQLQRLLLLEGWILDDTGTHGNRLRKKFPDGRTRLTLVSTKNNKPLPHNTLHQILGLKQTGLGTAGLRRLIKTHGLR